MDARHDPRAEYGAALPRGRQTRGARPAPTTAWCGRGRRWLRPPSLVAWLAFWAQDALCMVAGGAGRRVRRACGLARPRHPPPPHRRAPRDVLRARPRAPRPSMGRAGRGRRRLPRSRPSVRRRPGSVRRRGRCSSCCARRARKRAKRRWPAGCSRPAAPDVIAARQEAVRELAPRLDLREDLALLGDDLRGSVHPDRLAAWGARAAAAGLARRPGAAAALAVAGATAARRCGSAASRALRPFVAAVLARSRARAAAAAPRAARGARRGPAGPRTGAAFGPARADRTRAAREPPPRGACAPASNRRRAALPPHRRAAPSGHAARCAAESDVRAPVLPAALGDAVRLRHRGVAGRVRGGGRRLVRGRGRVRGALRRLRATRSRTRPIRSRRSPRATAARFEGEGLGHPLIPREANVRNDVRLASAATDGAPSVLVVSGSNMSGKSTLLRTVGVNAVLALAGAPVRATRLRLTPLAVGATLRIQDSLQGGTVALLRRGHSPAHDCRPRAGPAAAAVPARRAAERHQLPRPPRRRRGAGARPGRPRRDRPGDDPRPRSGGDRGRRSARGRPTSTSRTTSRTGAWCSTTAAGQAP